MNNCFFLIAFALVLSCAKSTIPIDPAAEFQQSGAQQQLANPILQPSANLVTAPFSFAQAEGDRDSDGRPDLADNCPNTANFSQEDKDADGLGDLCDPAPNKHNYSFKAMSLAETAAISTPNGTGGESAQVGTATGTEAGFAVLPLSIERACSGERVDGEDGTFLSTAEQPIAVITDAATREAISIKHLTPADIYLREGSPVMDMTYDPSKITAKSDLYFQACDDANGNDRCDYEGKTIELNLTHRHPFQDKGLKTSTPTSLAAIIQHGSGNGGSLTLGDLQQQDTPIPMGTRLTSLSALNRIKLFVLNKRYDSGKAARSKSKKQVIDSSRLGAEQDQPGAESPVGSTAQEPGSADETVAFTCDAGYSPLVLDLDARGIQLAGPSVLFNLAPTPSNDVAELTGWVISQHTPFLVKDRNGNGIIDDGSELFGNFTPIETSKEIAANGFMALAQYDANHDGYFDKQDSAYDQLLLWEDANLDGKSQQDELSPLSKEGIHAISLAYDESKVEEDIFFNKTIQRSSFLLEIPGQQLQPRAIFDIWFATQDTDLRPE